MAMFFKGLAVAAGVILLALAATVMGGRMIWMLGGAHGLDIDGSAPRIQAAPASGVWSSYGGDPGGMRYSSLEDITPQNVTSLEIAWTYSTGDLVNKPKAILRSAGETTPILVEESLVFCTPFNEVIAVEPGSGAERWRFDPKISLEQRPANQYVCRGVAYWRDDAAVGEQCASRIFTGTNDGRLIALDAKSGQPCAGFGDSGEVRIDPGMALLWPGEFQITSPPVIIGNIVVIGSSISDNARVEAPHGTVRAFDAHTGAPLWTFDPVPRSEDASNASDWDSPFPRREGHANVWAPMSVDAERGLIFAPTSSPSPDFFGGLRPGDNRYANSVVALKAETGDVAWSFQTVHHDVWDYDVPAQPGLYTVVKDGAEHDIVAQVTKTGFVFELDRDTGTPFLPIEERATPQDGAPGEVLSPTQPFPVATPPIVPSALSADEAFGLTWFDRRACAKAIRAARKEGLFTPITETPTIVRPFTGGGANWGGGAFDPSRNLLVVNMSNITHLLQLIPSKDVDAARETYHDSEIAPQTGAPYGVRRDLLVSPLGLPCSPPPWGVIAAVDLADGRIVWRKTLGTVEDLSEGASKAMLGTPTLGGPIVTAGGLVFIASTMDFYLRAFNVETGEELWKGRLPAAGIATPMTYEWKGRQYVAIFAGGYSNIDLPRGDTLVTFALPDEVTAETRR